MASIVSLNLDDATFRKLMMIQILGENGVAIAKALSIDLTELVEFGKEQGLLNDACFIALLEAVHERDRIAKLEIEREKIITESSQLVSNI